MSHFGIRIYLDLRGQILLRASYAHACPESYAKTTVPGHSKWATVAVFQYFMLHETNFRRKVIHPIKQKGVLAS